LGNLSDYNFGIQEYEITEEIKQSPLISIW